MTKITDVTPAYAEAATSWQLLSLYNEAAAEMGLTAVKKFADKETAIRRTLAIRETLETYRRERTITVVGEIEIKPHPVMTQAVIAARDSGTGKSTIPEAVREALSSTVDKSPVPPPAPSLPIPSDDPEKDSQMPQLRKAAKPTELAPKDRVFPRRAGSKQALLVDLLSRPQGATFAELYDAMRLTGKPWQGITVRSALPWDINSVAGYGVTSEMLNGAQFAAQALKSLCAGQEERAYEALRMGMVRAGHGWAEGPAYNPDIRLPVYRLTYPAGMTAPLPHVPAKAPKPSSEQVAAAKKATEAALRAVTEGKG